MKNLFIMHTQYNLILSTGILKRYQDAENILLLYCEFNLTDEIYRALEKAYSKVIVIRDKYIAFSSASKEIKFIRSSLHKIKNLFSEKFDNVFLSQERILDVAIYSRLKRKNPGLKCFQIEEDAYYSINNRYHDEKYVQKYTLKEKLSRLRYAVMVRGSSTVLRENIYCYGMWSGYDGVYVLYPDLVRRELKGKKIIGITSEELAYGINSIYSDVNTIYPEKEKYTLFFFDLMERYSNPSKVKDIIKNIIALSLKSGRTVLFKYHPRETEKIGNICGAFELQHLIPAEKILSDLKGKDVVVIGNATTSCVVAAKLGFNVISICKIEFDTNDRMHTCMEEMGIHCIEDPNNIEF